MVLTLDFFNEQMPGEGTKYIIRKHLAKLVTNCLKDIHDFSLKNNLKEKSMC